MGNKKILLKKNKFKYTDDRDQLPPSFAGKDKASIVKEKSTLRSLNVTFPQAKDNLLVHSYHITAKKQGNRGARRRFHRIF
ncbi:hypothetical protein RCO48_22390 [Peribacillus frigoritolerans]|nr:hypothetical protein [Peribacillus frigoritolerans]